MNSKKREKDMTPDEPPGWAWRPVYYWEDLYNWTPCWTNSRLLIFSESLVASLFLSKGLLINTGICVLLKQSPSSLGPCPTPLCRKPHEDLTWCPGHPSTLNHSPSLRDPLMSVCRPAVLSSCYLLWTGLLRPDGVSETCGQTRRPGPQRSLFCRKGNWASPLPGPHSPGGALGTPRRPKCQRKEPTRFWAGIPPFNPSGLRIHIPELLGETFPCGPSLLLCTYTSFTRHIGSIFSWLLYTLNHLWNDFVHDFFI